jgi:hypothetical protein
MVSRTYEELLFDAINTILEPEGFRRKGNSFLLSSDDVVLIVNLQKSSKCNRDKLVVTLNCGVLSIPLKELSTAHHAISIWACHWNQRIGQLLPERKDKWWEFVDIEQVSYACEEIKILINNVIIPELHKVDSTQKLFQFWCSGGYGGLTEKQREKYVGLLKQRGYAGTH